MMTSVHCNYDNQIAGNYDLEKTIGKGHFAVVKLARHAFTGERVAVKIIDKTKLDPISRDHLFQEVLCMKLVQHPHVVRLYEVIDTTNKLYLIQEWGDGGDLYDYIMGHNRGLTEEIARKYFTQILSAIHFCHELHVVHRDLKPENCVFFKSTGTVKLTDFGFSNKFTPGTHLQTSCGSLAYSAPEILLGDPYDPPKVDIWSLGCILYCMVCGELPFQEANDSETLTKIMDCLYTLPNHLSAACCDLIQKMLRRDPDKRASLPEIMRHHWICENEKENLNSEKISTVCEAEGHNDAMCCNLPLICQHRLEYEDHMEILNLMSDGAVGTQAEIQSALDANEYNYLTATYFLLVERKLMRSLGGYRQHVEGTTNSSSANTTSIGAASLSHSSLETSPQQLKPDLTSSSNLLIHSPSASLGAIRILTNDLTTTAAEDRLRRFSMILEDEEEKDEEELYLEEVSLVVVEEEANEDEVDEQEDSQKPASETSQQSFQKSSSIRLHRGRTTSSCSVELGEELIMDPQGVAILRYASSAVDNFHHRSFRSSKPPLRRGSLGHINSLPYLLEEDQAGGVSSAQLDSSTMSSALPLSYSRRHGAVALSYPHAVPPMSGRRSSGRKSRGKRRSLPPSSTASSPPNHRRRRLRLNHSKTGSRSYSNSSDNSDTEVYILHERSLPHTASADEDILQSVSHTSSPPSALLTTLPSKVQTFSRKQLTHTPPQNNSRSSSGSNLRDHCAPIQEDDEPPAAMPLHTAFHQSFTMTNHATSPTPLFVSGGSTKGVGGSATSTPVGQHYISPQQLHELSRRRSDYDQIGMTDTPARHSVHGTINYRSSQISGVGRVASSLSSVSHSNISLSSLASSLRGSKLMMEVIRGAFELQLQQRSKGASSVSSSASQHERLDQVNHEQGGGGLSSPSGLILPSSTAIMTISEHDHTNSQCSHSDAESLMECARGGGGSDEMLNTIANSYAHVDGACSLEEGVVSTNLPTTPEIEIVHDDHLEVEGAGQKMKLRFKMQCCRVS